MKAVLMLVIVALAGCAGQVDPEPRTVRVEVPVAVPCRVPAVEVPAWATAGLKKSDDIQTKVRALLAERLQRIGYGRTSWLRTRPVRIRSRLRPFPTELGDAGHSIQGLVGETRPPGGQRWQVRHLVVPRLGEQLRPGHGDDSPACCYSACGAERRRGGRGIHL